VSDWIRLVVCVGLLVLVVARHGDESVRDDSLYALLNGLPDGLRSFFSLLYDFGALWALGIVVVAAVVVRRWRLARDLAIAGVLAWAIARIVGATVAGGDSVSGSFRVVTRLGTTPSFPAVRLAVIVAVIAVAAPYVSRPMRRVGWLVVVTMAAATLYLGATASGGAFAAVLLGIAIAAAVHVVFGSPGGRPTRAQVREALAELGVDAGPVELVRSPPAHTTLMTTSDDGGALSVLVLGRDEADAQVLSKLGRFLVYKDSGPTLHLTRLEAVQEEAYSLLLAERTGVRAPRVVVAGTAGPGMALLATRAPEGPTLDDVDDERVTDLFLRELWQQVGLLHGARVAHGQLSGHNIVLTADGPALAGFHRAAGTAPPRRLAADVAELLVTTAGIAGEARAVAAALAVLGAEALGDALPLLQPAALSRDVRPRSWRGHKDFTHQVDAVRAEAAHAIGVEEPPLQQLHRVSGTNLMMAVGTLIAISVLLSQVGSPQELWDTITNASPAWLTVAIVVSFATNCATAIALMGTVPIPLPLWRTSELQLSMSFSNLAIPAVGGMAAQIRFLQKQGVDLASAVASGGLLINVGNIVAQVILLGFAVALSPDTFRVQSIPTSSIVELVLVVILVAAVVVGLVLGIPKLRALVMPPVRSATTTMWQAVRSPRRLALLLGGNALNALMYAAVMLACVEAFGGSIDFFTLLALNIFISTIASLVPIPGGNTAVATVGMSGAMTAFGVSTEVAVAAVLANQLVANYLPAIPGWFATNDLLRRDYL